MLPKIWIFDTYTILLLIGVLCCFGLLKLYVNKYKLKDNYFYDIIFIGCIAIMIGLVFAVGFQTLFDLIKENSTNPLFAMTFFGGLVGGIAGFLVLYFTYIKKRYPHAKLKDDILIISPACITVAHAFGRLGCFCAGCCYGKETDSILGVNFPRLGHAVYPTQLFEAGFLLILSLILFILAYKKNFKYTFPIYLASYGVWRFMLEFLRGDERGAFFLGLSPSQWFSICALIAAVLLTIYLKIINKVKNA